MAVAAATHEGREEIPLAALSRIAAAGSDFNFGPTKEAGFGQDLTQRNAANWT
jgi:hypothetical protein